MAILESVIHSAYSLSLSNAAKKFNEAANVPAAIQQQKLNDIVDANTESAYLSHWFGQKRYSQTWNVEKFRETLPIVSYEDLVPWIEKTDRSDAKQLTEAEVLCWEPTSGSTQTKKWIPYTASLLKEFSTAIDPWLYSLYQNHRGIKSGKHYWSISMAAADSQKSTSSIPIGLEDDTSYLGPLARAAMRRVMAVPQCVKYEASDFRWRFKTCLHLLGCESLSLISVWSPTFLIALCGFIKENWFELLAELPRPRRQYLDKTVKQARNFENIWPHLSVISCWTDGPAYQYAINLRHYFPRVDIQGKGLLTTEGVVSLPFLASSQDNAQRISQGGVLALQSHFFEFLPNGDVNRPSVLAHELEPGERYSPVITTSGGLYRYRIDDLVECTGFYGATPQLKFLGKRGGISDVAGEKLSVDFIQTVIERALKNSSLEFEFLLVTPPSQVPGAYTVFLETNAPDKQVRDFLDALEKELSETYHYRQCRRIGQLTAVEVNHVKQAWPLYQETFQQAGVKIGDVKPSYFNDRFDWHCVFRRCKTPNIFEMEAG